MSDPGEMYQAVILDHNAKPRNFGDLQNATHKADGDNPMCGDNYTVYLEMDGEKVVDVSFAGCGCAISKASGSLMTQAVKGKTRAEVEELFLRFHEVVTGDASTTTDARDEVERLGKLAVFAGVREYPARVKCATLSWHTVRSALGAGGIVSTE